MMDILDELESIAMITGGGSEVFKKVDNLVNIILTRAQKAESELETLRAKVVGERKLMDEHRSAETLIMNNNDQLREEISGLREKHKELMEQEPVYQYSSTNNTSLWTDCTKETYSIMKDEYRRIVYTQPVQPSPAVVVPSGCKLVPIESTEKMQDATCYVFTSSREGTAWSEFWDAAIQASPDIKIINQSHELEKLKVGISSIVKTVKPLSNFAEYQVLNLSPTQIINLVNELLSTPTPPSAEQYEIINIAEFAKGWTDWFKSEEHGVTVVKTEILNRYLKVEQPDSAGGK